jgi:hypothetical protein
VAASMTPMVGDKLAPLIGVGGHLLDHKAGALAPASMDKGEMTQTAALATRFNPRHASTLTIS